MDYIATKDGKILNVLGQEIKQQKHHKGYLIFFEHNPEKYEHVRKKRKTWKSQRFIWIYFNGEIPKGLEIDHINHIKTDNRLENLRLVTPKQNNRDRPYCKLSMEKAEEIRRKYTHSNKSYDTLAEEYEVSKTTIHDVIKLKRWV